MADEIHAARYVRKAHTTSIATFASPGAGPLGTVVEGRPRVLLQPPVPTVPSPLRINRAVRVALVTLSLGDQGELIDAVDDRFDGLVVAAFGAGHVPGWLVPSLEDLATRMPVVLASRAGCRIDPEYDVPRTWIGVRPSRSRPHLGRCPRRTEGTVAPACAAGRRGGPRTHRTDLCRSDRGTLRRGLHGAVFSVELRLPSDAGVLTGVTLPTARGEVLAPQKSYGR